MRLQFLGSGDAFGSGGRFNTCFHLERAAHGNVLVDCGASSMVAIRKWRVEPNAVSTVLVSHLHGDHFAGLPFFQNTVFGTLFYSGLLFGTFALLRSRHPALALQTA